MQDPTPTILLAAAPERLEELRPLEARLAAEGRRVLRATRPEDVQVRALAADLVVAVHVPGAWTPLDCLDPRQSPVLVLAARPSIEEALEALRAGFIDYARLGAPADDLVARVARALTRGGRRGPPSIEPPQIIGRSAALAEAQRLVKRVAESAASTVLVTGESGTGKDVIARAIHALSPRAAAPFMNITCSAIPETLLESELFGHERGAFTDARERKAGLLEQATGGTVFLDELGEMSLVLQAKLLRFLEERAFRRVGGHEDLRPDVRIVAATNRDLLARVREGHFRADLYYRLAVVELSLPPLRERTDDIEPLARHFIARFSDELRRPPCRITPEALRLLQRYPWPGNVRELRNTIERAVLLCEGPDLDTELLQLDLTRATRTLDAPGFRLPEGGLVLRDLERELLKQALQLSGGNQTEAARLLGMSRDQVRYRVEKHDLLAPWREGGAAPPEEDGPRLSRAPEGASAS
jgi:DNA-binding NtrC family response regulator